VRPVVIDTSAGAEIVTDTKEAKAVAQGRHVSGKG
jgi:hypothetical protein